jgi:hypothetical protein
MEQTPANSAMEPEEDPSEIEQQIRKLESQLVEALIKKDLAEARRLVADGFTVVGPDGVVYTKAQYIDRFKPRDWAVDSMVLSDLKVRVYGDTAVVTSIGTYQQTIKGQPRRSSLRRTCTWAKVGSSWQCVAAKVTKIAK